MEVAFGIMETVLGLMVVSWVIGTPFVAAIFGIHAVFVRVWHIGRYNVFHWVDIVALPTVVFSYCIMAMYHSAGKTLSNLWAEMPLSCMTWCALFAVRCVMVLCGAKWSNRTYAIVGLALALAATVAIHFLTPPLPE